jgi:hypothetical protein
VPASGTVDGDTAVSVTCGFEPRAARTVRPAWCGWLVPRLPCGDDSSEDRGNHGLMDRNASSALDLSDAIGLLNWLLVGGPPHAMGEECRGIEGCPARCGP